MKFKLLLDTCLVACCLITTLSCRKTDLLDTVNVEKISTKFFNLAAGTDVEVAKVARDMKKQDSLFHFIPSFVSKNGTPAGIRFFIK